MYKPYGFPAIFRSLVIIQTHDYGESRYPVVFVESLYGSLDNPMPFCWLIWSQFSVCVFSNQPNTSCFKSALNAYMIRWGGFDNFRYVRNQSFISYCSSKGSMCGVCVFNSCGHDTFEQLLDSFSVWLHVLCCPWI